jgi:hypothetical protein
MYQIRKLIEENRKEPYGTGYLAGPYYTTLALDYLQMDEVVVENVTDAESADLEQPITKEDWANS